MWKTSPCHDIIIICLPGSWGGFPRCLVSPSIIHNQLETMTVDFRLPRFVIFCEWNAMCNTQNELKVNLTALNYTTMLEESRTVTGKTGKKLIQYSNHRTTNVIFYWAVYIYIYINIHSQKHRHTDINMYPHVDWRVWDRGCISVMWYFCRFWISGVHSTRGCFIVWDWFPV